MIEIDASVDTKLRKDSFYRCRYVLDLKQETIFILRAITKQALWVQSCT